MLEKSEIQLDPVKSKRLSKTEYNQEKRSKTW